MEVTLRGKEQQAKMNTIVWTSLALFLALGFVKCQKLTSDINTDTEVSQYSSTVISKDSEEDVEIRDKEGNLVSTTELFLNEGYQIEKAVERNVCLIRASESNSTCYSEMPMTDQLPQLILDHCVGREIKTLEPMDCEDNTSDHKESDGAASRFRRSTWNRCCRYTYTISNDCTCKYCCRKILGICVKWCCKTYTKKIIWTQQCSSGYTSMFHVYV